MRTLATFVIAALIGAFVPVAAGATPAGAAYPRCDSFHDFPTSTSLRVREPVVSTTNHSTACTLRLHDNTFGVAALRFALDSCHRAGLGVSGVYDQSVYNVIVLLQRVARIDDDGIYGPETRRYAVDMPLVDRDGDWAGGCRTFA